MYGIADHQRRRDREIVEGADVETRRLGDVSGWIAVEHEFIEPSAATGRDHSPPLRAGRAAPRVAHVGRRDADAIADPLDTLQPTDQPVDARRERGLLLAHRARVVHHEQDVDGGRTRGRGAGVDAGLVAGGEIGGRSGSVGGAPVGARARVVAAQGRRQDAGRGREEGNQRVRTRDDGTMHGRAPWDPPDRRRVGRANATGCRAKRVVEPVVVSGRRASTRRAPWVRGVSSANGGGTRRAGPSRRDRRGTARRSAPPRGPRP
jgi:hypothetical protein